VLSFCVSSLYFLFVGELLLTGLKYAYLSIHFKVYFVFLARHKHVSHLALGFFYHLFITLELCSMNLFSPRNSVVFLTNLHFTSRNTSVISWVNNRERSRTSRDTPARKRQPSDTQILELSDSDTPGIRQYVLLRRQSN